MTVIDFGLIEKARPHLAAALATFGEPGDDPREVNRIIAANALAAGFSATAAGRLLDHLQAFVHGLQGARMDPFLQGIPAQDPRALFGSDCLGGLFAPHSAPVADRPWELPLPGEAEARDRILIEQLVAATRLYATGKAVKELLAFTTRLRAFAPFNAMILHIQKPGLTHAATAADWLTRFGRVPKRGARPLVVLRSMGPVDFVFDVLDTEGHPLPEQAFAFPTLGNLSTERFAKIVVATTKCGIDLTELDLGDGQAGWIHRLGSPAPKKKQRYQLAFNRNHSMPTRLVTIAHELAHLYLGHLGEDRTRDIRDRSRLPHARCEVEAEMAAYLVAKRNGLTPRSESYLDAYTGAFADLDLVSVMRAANEVEVTMGIAAHQLKTQAANEAKEAHVANQHAIPE